jgi:hypothetical protein
VRLLTREGNVPSEDYLLTTSVAQRDADQRNRFIDQKNYLLSTELAGNLPSHTVTVMGDTATYNLALQWDQRWALSGDSEDTLQPGARLKLGTYRLDTLQALEQNETRLEMSDIKPLLVEEGAALETAPPYPYRLLRAETPLALYFEVYNLDFGPSDQTAYAVSYEVVRRGERRLGPNDDSRTRSRTAYTGESRTACEFIMPDLQDEATSGDLDIVIYVTDENSGQSVSRSIPFEYR